MVEILYFLFYLFFSSYHIHNIWVHTVSFFSFFAFFFLFPFSWHAWWLCAPLHWFYIDAHQFFPSLSHLRVPSVSKIPGMARLGLLQGGWVGGMFFKRQRQKGEGVFFLSPLDFSHFSPSLILKRCCAVDCHWSLIRECSYPASILVKHLSLFFFSTVFVLENIRMLWKILLWSWCVSFCFCTRDILFGVGDRILQTAKARGYQF